jgi:hypothetical protein
MIRLHLNLIYAASEEIVLNKTHWLPVRMGILEPFGGFSRTS